MRIELQTRWVIAGLWLLVGCTAKPLPQRTSASPPSSGDIEVKAWHTIEPFEQPLAQLPTVFWEPDDTTTLRAWMADGEHMRGKRVLEIGSGTGLISLCCLQAGAAHVTALDINPFAVINTSYNADRLGLSSQLKVLQVTSLQQSPFDVLPAGERFDIIVSNPPWEDAPVQSLDQYALYDPGLKLCERILNESAQWLQPDGQLILVYGACTAIEVIQAKAPEAGWRIQVRDDRRLDQLPEVFVPGIMLELRHP
jgi:methylase of polypeptide subunit release factors